MRNHLSIISRTLMLTACDAACKPALWAVIYTLSYHPHRAYFQWRELKVNGVERAPKGGQRRQPFPAPIPQRTAPAFCNFCCADCSGATSASAATASLSSDRGDRNISGKTILQDKSYAFPFTVGAPPFCPATYMCAHSSTAFQSPAGSAKDVKTSQDEVTRTFYAEMGQSSQACR